MVDLQKSFFDPRFSLRKERANAFERAEITGEGGPFTTGAFLGRARSLQSGNIQFHFVRE
jgi:hypothetical protein